MGAACFVGTYIHEVPTRARGVIVMDKTAFFTMPSGLYVVSAAADGLRAGCGINTAVQVTSMPPRISVAVNKDNVTSGVIASAKAFALTVIDQTADLLYIGNFGFRTRRLIDSVDVGSHLLFFGEVEDTKRQSDETPLTYDYYHKVLKGKTPPKASSYQG